MGNWTTPALVSDHLLHTFQGALSFEDEPITLIGTTPSNLQNRLLTSGSETLKWCTLKEPEMSTEVMTGEVEQSLGQTNIVKGSVFVAHYQVLTFTYVETKDYIVDYSAGTIRRSSTSTMVSGATVYVYFLYWTPFTITTNYTIDYEAGTVTRVGSAIPDGGTIYIDYDVDAASIADSLIDAAILEAEDKILGRLSSAYTIASADQGLKTGATELSISIIAQSLSIYALQHESLSDSDQRAEEFRLLSIRLEAQAWRTLATFLDPTARSGPEKHPNI